MTSKNPSFERALGLEQTFTDTPRFGHSNKFALLFNDAKRDDYLIGVSTLALILACFFLCWLLFLLILKCMGKSRVGFLSGAPYDARTPDGDINRRPVRGRIVFGLSAFGMIAFTLLMVLIGFPGLEDMSSDLADGAELGGDILRDGETATGAFVAGSERVLSTRDVAVANLNNAFRTGRTVAPAWTEASPPGNSSVPENFTVNSTATTVPPPNYINIAIQSRVKSVLESLGGLNDTAQNEGNDLMDALGEGQDRFDTMSSTLDSVDLTTLQISVGVSFSLLPFILLLIMIAVATGVTNTCLHCFTFFMIFLFATFILFLLILTCLASISGILNGDFCHSGFDQTPDSTILEILMQLGSDKDSFAFRSTTYVLRDCVPPPEPMTYPLDFMTGFETAIRAAVANVTLLAEEIEVLGVENLSRDLEFDVSTVKGELANFEERVTESIETVTYALADLGCQRLREIYDKAVGEAICNYTGVMWTFYSCLAMTFFGCMMLTFRSTLFPVSAALGNDYMEKSATDEDVGEDDKQSENTGTGTGEEPEPSGDVFLDEPEGEAEQANQTPSNREDPVEVMEVGFDKEPDPAKIVVIPQPPGAEYDFIIWA